MILIQPHEFKSVPCDRITNAVATNCNDILKKFSNNIKINIVRLIDWAIKTFPFFSFGFRSLASSASSFFRLPTANKFTSQNVCVGFIARVFAYFIFTSIHWIVVYFANTYTYTWTRHARIQGGVTRFRKRNHKNYQHLQRQTEMIKKAATLSLSFIFYVFLFW